MAGSEKGYLENVAESVKKSLNFSSNQEGEDGKKFQRHDIKFILLMLGLILLFSLRGGQITGAIAATCRQVFVSVFYGFGIIFIITGLSKKMFKYDPSRVQIVRWAMELALFFAVSQFLHEGFLMYTGQIPPSQ